MRFRHVSLPCIQMQQYSKVFKRKSPKSTVMLLLASFSRLIQLFHRSVITHLHRQLAPTFLPAETIPASQFFLSTTPFQPSTHQLSIFRCSNASRTLTGTRTPCTFLNIQHTAMTAARPPPAIPLCRKQRDELPAISGVRSNHVSQLSPRHNVFHIIKYSVVIRVIMIFRGYQY
jgi:hypothetical protein